MQGVGAAFIMPATLSILTNVFATPSAGKAIGIWAGVSGLGVAIGPVTGGWLLDHYWWGSIFIVNIPIVIVAVVATVLIVPDLDGIRRRTYRHPRDGALDRDAGDPPLRHHRGAERTGGHRP